jgi:thioredoxin-related protein
MKKIIKLSVILLLLSCSNKNSTSSKDAKNNNTSTAEKTTTIQPAPEAKPEENKDEIKWMSYDEALKHSRKKPKKIFVDVYTDWCGWCKKMDKTTLKDPRIIAYMNKHYYAVKLNAESDKAVSFQGKAMTEKELAGKVFKITGYPSTVYLESDEKIIQPVPGYMDVPTLDKILHYIGEDHYKTTTWENFQMSYQE